MLKFFPKEYEDRSRFSLLKESPIGEKASLEVEILGSGQILKPRKNMSILKVPFKDNSGQGYLTFFNQEYLKNKFNIGDIFKIHGKINKIGMELQVTNPIFEKKELNSNLGRIIPLYSLTKGLTNNDILKIMTIAVKENVDLLQENLPLYMMHKYNLMSIKDSIKNIHYPINSEKLKQAQNRLKFEELLILQLGLFMIKSSSTTDNKGISFCKFKDTKKMINSLSFKLTNAQTRVIEEIEKDMDSDKQMNRLIQGDVGSGKTIIAAIAMFKCVKSGYQSAMLAPTEILATQHFKSLEPIFDEWGIKCELLIGSLTPKNKAKVLEKLKNGEIDILIGTHAIIQEGIEFDRLGLAITDEQHRFGVKQRAILNKKGNNPDIIVMTATPIPRTLALILYGDLDISIIDELPPGRKEIETFAIGPNMIERMNGFIKKQILEGRQAYIVCPLIEESESLNLNSAQEIYTELKDNTFKEFKVGLLHGKMNSKEKDEIMQMFKNKNLDILISTTVIEVGVNVPNANIMTIYNSERFGLAQLHQLRGRVGRGEYQSYCILINYSKNKIARERMRILQDSTDGFKISEKDLEIRGPGEFFGTRQHGLPELKIANLFTDIRILKIVQKEALEIMRIDPNLERLEHQKLKIEIKNMFKDVGEDLILN
ncbi:ATP-dependent DNA helicase RecG [Tissierella creatinophila DSM 6911]|uniref:ATP-dependent DNA helicase RecG n=1 Tax=Tissierella creatinophila DSM 6911 TaxID=1123403 RepID=A0A1U7M349_TISCR|nr:ATP-dependent DNA helicase RecG [Tissierella creatinophila DSM 6911]